MDSTKSELDAVHPPVSDRSARYMAGVGRHLLRVLVVIFVVPLVMLKAAHSFTKSSAADHAVEPAASAALKTSLTGSGIMIGAGAWDANSLAILGGFAIAAMGFLWNAWMGWRKDRRDRQEREERRLEHEAHMLEHKARMSELHE